jgi:hypothetical protein
MDESAETTRPSTYATESGIGGLFVLSLKLLVANILVSLLIAFLALPFSTMNGR